MSTTSVDRLAGVSSSVALKAPCDYTTTANITLSGLAVQAGGTWASTLTQDDANPTRILVKNQTNAIDNGLWNPGAGTWTRCKDFDGARDVVRGTVVHVYQFDGDLWFEVSTANPIVIGTSEINFVASTAASILARLASTASAADGAALIARGAQVVGSITALKALDKNNPSKYAYVTGYYTPGDGGGGLYYYDSADTTTADNTGTVIVATDSARWKLVRNGFVTLEQFGAKGDGSTSDATPANQACKWCFETGDTLKLKGKHYAGARLESHGSFNIEGNGATVEYLGVGYTLIAGTGTGTSAVPTAWPTDASIFNASAYLPTLYAITATATLGAQSLGVGSSAGIVAGDLVFICDSATSASTPSNYIPRDFEFARVLSVSPTLITLVGRLKNAYTTAGVIVKCPGIATNCTISDLKLKSPSDAYQMVIRSAYNVELVNIEAAGQDAVGSATFSDLLKFENIKASGTYGSLSTARGCVDVTIDGYEWQPRTGSVGEDCTVFVEESFYKLTFRNVRGNGGYFSIRQVDMTGAVAKRTVTVENSLFDTLNASNGATSPMQCGNMTGASLTFIGTALLGTCVTPNASVYPGIAGAPFSWISSCASNDVIKFMGCTFNASNAGAVFTPGSGFLGSVQFDEMCNYTTCTPPLTQYTPRGAWVSVSPTSPYTTISGYALQYRLQNKTVYVTGAMQLNGAASGSQMFTLSSGYRPDSQKLIGVAAYDSTGTVPRPAMVNIATGGAVTLYYSGTTTYASVEFSFPID